MIEEIKKLYKKTDLILGLEIIYRNKNNNKNYEFNYFKNTTEKLNWI
jgi:tagatose-1,6-bisphosphate aldolase